MVLDDHRAGAARDIGAVLVALAHGAASINRRERAAADSIRALRHSGPLRQKPASRPGGFRAEFSDGHPPSHSTTDAPDWASRPGPDAVTSQLPVGTGDSRTADAGHFE